MKKRGKKLNIIEKKLGKIIAIIGFILAIIGFIGTILSIYTNAFSKLAIMSSFPVVYWISIGFCVVSLLIGKQGKGLAIFGLIIDAITIFLAFGVFIQ